MNKNIMREAIKLANESIKDGGGPFAAIITKNNEIIAYGTNQVTNNNDPTAHAEVVAIRNAAKTLENFNLAGCEIYTTCEPCPMCLGAIYWAKISKIYYGNTKEDAANIGFDDQFIYEELELPKEKRQLAMEALLRDETIETFKIWDKMSDKKEY